MSSPATADSAESLSQPTTDRIGVVAKGRLFGAVGSPGGQRRDSVAGVGRL
jgi:hypothetical protein